MKNYLKSLLLFSKISIKHRLTLFIFILLFIVISVLAITSYIGIRNKSLEVGYERIKVLTEQFSTLFAASSAKIKSSTQKVAQEKVVINYVLSPENKSNIAALKNMQGLKFTADTLNLTVNILNKGKIKLFSTNGSDNSFPSISDSEFNKANINLSAVGKLRVVRDSIFYPIVSSITNRNKIIGYLVRWRLVTSNRKALDQLRGLLGGGAAIYVGNDDGTVWTNFIRILPKPPIKKIANGIIEHKNLNEEQVIASVHKINGTPWVFLIELSKKEILEASSKFLQWIIIVGLIVFAIGFLAAWLIGRNITNPLNKLTLATADIANGNYSSLVKVDRVDEIGRLGNSFNAMVTKVKEYQFELENKVEQRTADLKTANEELEKVNNKLKDLDEIKTNFFTNVSHELRTPLALILGPTEKLLSNENNSDENEEKLILIQKNARVLLKHVNNLLDLSKLEVGKLKINYANFDLSKTVKIVCSYFESLAHQHNINFVVSLPEKLIVQADPEKIERVLMNLLSNAFKHTPSGGIIECNLFENENKAFFELRDNGPGIEPDSLETIFERFHREEKGLNRNLGGVGLGLSIVKEFIELHKGKIRVQNNENGGAAFNFYIPLKAPEGTEIHQMAKDSIFSGEELNTELAKKTVEIEITSKIKNDSFILNPDAPSILIVEDNIEMNDFICEILKGGYNIYSAYDGEEGFKKTVQYKPDLIITDIMMPKMSGDRLVEKIKSDINTSFIPIILLTSKADDKLKIELLSRGVHDYLNKPFTIEELKARVNNIVNIKVAKDLLQKELESKTENISSLIIELTDKKHIVEAGLKERETLLREIHHRVKNNLQVIMSLLNLQADKINDFNLLEVFKESQNRIRSMALIHEKLYKNNNFVEVDLKEYIHDLTEFLLNSYCDDSRKIILKTHVDHISIDMDLTISLGLIINEIVSNSLKHAFKDEENGEILVSLKHENENAYILTVKDSGKGISETYTDMEPAKTFGFELIETLVNQINGKINVTNSNGTEIRIEFPIPGLKLIS